MKDFAAAWEMQDYILISRLEEIAWLYNLRGRDIKHTPVFYGFALVSKTDTTLYVMDEKYCKACIGDVRPYEKIFSDIKKLQNCSVMIDENTVSYLIGKSFNSSVKKIIGKSPVEKMKGCEESQGNSFDKKRSYKRRGSSGGIYLLAQGKHRKRIYYRNFRCRLS